MPRGLGPLVALVAACGGGALPSPPRVGAMADTWVQEFDARGIPHAADLGLSGGEIVVGGSFSGALRFGRERLDSAGLDDGFVARFARDGRLRWARHLGGSGHDAVRAVAVDGDGHAIVAGVFERALRASSGELRSPAGHRGGFLIALDDDGDELWVRGFSASGSLLLTALAADRRGGLLVAGAFDGELVVPGAEPLRAAGTQDAFVARLSADGTVMWVRRDGDAGPAYARGVAATPDGDIVVGGAFSGTLRLGELELVASQGSQDGVVMRLTGDTGQPRWARALGGDADDAVHAVAAAEDGRICVAGSLGGPAVLGRQAVQPSGPRDGFAACLDPDDGIPRWVTPLRGDGGDGIDRLAIAGDRLAVAGSFDGALAPEGIEPLRAAGATDAFVLVLDADSGRPLAATRFGSETGHDQVSALAFDGPGTVVGAGRQTARDGAELFVFRLPRGP